MLTQEVEITFIHMRKNKDFLVYLLENISIKLEKYFVTEILQVQNCDKVANYEKIILEIVSFWERY